MTRKTFFQERTVAEIARLPKRVIYNQRHLARLIDDLHPEDALVVSAQIIPGRFYIKAKDSAEAARRCHHHGDLIKLDNPKSQQECYASPKIPLELRAEAFEKLRGMREEEINYIGYSTQLEFGDRKKRVFPFVWMPEGERLFSFAETQTPEGLVIEDYPDAKRVVREGASVVASVSSREKKNLRYRFKLLHIPMIRGRENLATVLQLKQASFVDQETGEPISRRPLHENYNIRYSGESDPESSERIELYPQDVAAYLKIIRNTQKNHNLTPLEMNPFALFSKRGAGIYTRLCNNILVYDPKIERKDHLRKLRIAEKSILLSRAIGVFGHDEIAYWNSERDGKITDYDWSINGGNE